MGEYRVALRWDAHATPLVRQTGKILYLDATHVVEVTGIVAIATHAVSHLAHLPGYAAEMRQEALPLRRNRRTAVAVVAIAHAGDE